MSTNVFMSYVTNWRVSSSVTANYVVERGKVGMMKGALCNICMTPWMQKYLVQCNKSNHDVSPLFCHRGQLIKPLTSWSNSSICFVLQFASCPIPERAKRIITLDRYNITVRTMSSCVIKYILLVPFLIFIICLF